MGRLAKQQKLRRAYYDPRRPGAYAGAVGLQRNLHNLSTKEVKEWLSQQDAYTLHKPIRRHFQRRRIIAGGINHQFQADLIDMRSLRKYNNDRAYLVTCIDVFSKFAWAIPIKTKSGKALVEAIQTIFAQAKPFFLQTDKGSEFRNTKVLSFLKEEKVHFFTTENEDIKASIVERFNRTLKEKMWRYFTKTNQLRYIDVIDDLVHNYNNSYHRSIRMTPADVNIDNQEQVWNTLYASVVPDKKPVFKEGERVRIAQSRQTFKKGYVPGWSEEIYTIDKVNSQTNPITYKLTDYMNEPIIGNFYKEEIQKVGDKQVYRIEKIIRERRTVGGKEYLVKWFGYNSSFNSWISAKNISRYKD